MMKHDESLSLGHPPAGETCSTLPPPPSMALRRLLRRLLPVCSSLLLGLALLGCSAAAAGLNSYQSPDGRYAFLYPTGWTRVQVSGGPKVVFHDLINSDETLSLVISEVSSDSDLDSLGSAVAVGERLRRSVIAPEGSGRDAELVEAHEREQAGHTFYDLEYSVRLSDRERHELATAVVDRGRLYTFAASTNAVRWPRVKELFERVITSFNLLI
jgi:photosystem II oxygen-evolving enhancer protein 2